MTVKVFGIRHHGPGSARSLVRSLHTLQPDIILVEGPPDANDAIDWMAQPDMEPPVALLIYAPDRLEQAVYYPFAIFSPEWQAIHYGLQQNIPVRFMDLPQTHQLAQRLAQQQAIAAAKPDSEADLPEGGAESTERADMEPEDAKPEMAIAPSITPRTIPEDPLAWLAKAAGYTDSERWWEHMVEQRQDSTELFDAILEAMTALRQEMEQTYPPDHNNPADGREAQREAYMRRTIRQAQKEGFQTIAVVCGAWHSAALCEPFPTQKQDNALLKGLPKLKVKATWIPWTYGRLSSDSGYGAGIESPGWYDHLWRSTQATHNTSQTAIRWMTQVARLLRGEDLEASSASVIEAVRLAETLAALRNSAMPGLAEMNEAAQTVFCFGDATPMQLIRQKLIVSDRLGHVPAETPLIPLQQDLQQLQKRLRMKPQAQDHLWVLDLRKDLDRERSHLLHRLLLLNIPWGAPQQVSGKGTFKEAWQLRWQPELSLAVIEAGRWGNTVVMAAVAYANQEADAAPDLPQLTQFLDRVLLAALPAAIAHLMTRLQSAAAIANDVAHLMAALPPLANILRYRDVRQTDSTVVAHVVDGLVARICIGLPGACASLDDDAAATMLEAINQTHSAIKLLQQEAHAQAWSAVLLQLADRSSLHGLIAGRCCRLLLDEGSLPAEETARRLGLVLSLANEPTQAAAWVEGFLQGSGLLLLHDDAIWQVLDNWVTNLPDATFTALLPLLRRTFANFPAPERRQIGERVRTGTQKSSIAEVEANFDRDRADAVLPLIAQLLGL
ncbi:MAG: DUF5682 family protein [Cyanobacteria bacterium P01_F01_bin.86]